MKHTIVFSLGLALMGAVIGTAHAQREPIDRSDRRAQRQQMMQGMTPEQRTQFFQNQRQQRQAARNNGQTTTNGLTQNSGWQGGQGATGAGQGSQGANGGRTRNRNGNGNGNGSTNSNAPLSDADREAGMRALMNSAGITDKAQQDPIVAFVFAQTKAREPLLQNAQAVATLLRDGQSTPDQIQTKWTIYQNSLDADKRRFEKELAALDEKIGWSKDARLESFLALVGVLNPDSWVVGGAGAIFTPESQVRTVSTTAPTQNATAAPAPANGNTATQNG